MGSKDVVDRLIKPRGSSDRVFDVAPGAGIATGVWTSPPQAMAGMRGVSYRTEGAAGVPDEYGTIWKSGSDDYVRMAYVLSPSIVTSADPTVGIQAAIDAVDAAIGSTGGGAVVLPAGIFTVGTLSLRNHVALIGQGDGTTLKAKSNIGGPVLKNAADGARFLGIHHLRIDGSKANQSTG